MKRCQSWRALGRYRTTGATADWYDLDLPWFSGGTPASKGLVFHIQSFRKINFSGASWRRSRNSTDKRPSVRHKMLFRRKRFCRFTVAGVEEIDYKDIDTLRDFIARTADHSRTPDRHLRGICQRQLNTAIGVPAFWHCCPTATSTRSKEYRPCKSFCRQGREPG